MNKFVLFLTIFIITSIQARELNLSASVISDNEKIISSRNMGYIKSIKVNEGDKVKKGALLYEIDSIEIDNKKEQALLNIDIHKNQYDNVKLNYERYKRLYEKALVSKFDLEQLELKYNTISNSLKIANSKLKELKNQYKYLKVKAPNDGLIIKKSIKVGEMAMPGIPAIIISDLSNLKIVTQINEADLKYINLNDEVDVFIDSLDYKTKGKIISIIPSANPMTHSFTLKISFESNEKILPGMYANVLVSIKEQL
ncbi:MAG: efflux RND transporter periplasmic adaptor subunit [Arcobacter sp.]|uniref:efflux RND transporter periplasmic adaptor subunit n=1 Tax=uncultured Arcobacter sp. TaxID=165434 RepID=UPI000CA9A67F|nr:efflux RND transporter periplasmic adaptor subunit [uncultured Arcobacter sp.]PLY11213.1 MAG: efflux RND transporter periplasmic adaptor subunit [Arcobacter sp.]